MPWNLTRKNKWAMFTKGAFEEKQLGVTTLGSKSFLTLLKVSIFSTQNI